MAPGSEVAPLDAGRRTHPLTSVVLGLGWSAAAIVGLVSSLVQGGGFESWGLIALPVAAVGGVVVGSIIGWISWRFTLFVINDAEVKVDSGMLWKKSRRVPFERLQSVDIHEPFVARLFGLAELRLDSAGGSESRTAVRYLRLTEAQELRALLVRRAHARATGTPEESSGDVAPPPDALAPPLEVVAEVPPSRVVIGTLLSLDLLAAVTAAVLAVAASIWFAEPLAFFGGLLGAGGWAVQIVGSRVLDQWGYRLSRVPHGLRVERGLFTRTSETIPFDRVQGVAVVEPLVWRQLGWRQVLVAVAGAGGQGESGEQDKAATVLPIADPELARLVVDLLVPGAVEQLDERHTPPRSGWVFAPIGRRFRWIGADDVAMVSSTGWVTRRTSIVPHRKNQSVAVEQGPLQRRLGVASVSVHSPDGPVDVAGLHLGRDDAFAVATEASRRSRSR
ncbi:PH domain-containing protein [Aeromicrobium sp. Leaf350]|uniref:PH domain-containing protein n=1 Tax=Aeromicrobium sp. Leaf350 TaxID=2876565 RepID=UPI001E58BBB4|nr:PH domain-containing protein [Aeromicrobium sp. Leaf350]